MRDILSVKTSSPSGDLISYLAGFKRLYHDTGKKVHIYQRIGLIGKGYDSAHPSYTNDEGEGVAMNRYAFAMLRPLILSQEYVHSFEEFTGQPFDLDMDKCRLEVFTNQPHGSLNRYPFYVYPQMTTDLSEKWLKTNSSLFGRKKIIINFTKRYRNSLIHYHFLKKFQSDIVFAGLPYERDLFCSEWDLDIPLLQVDNFLELAKHIDWCPFFLGNQSFCFQLAEALKTPRILETSPMVPNVIPIGKKAYDFYHQDGLEYFFNKLYSEHFQ